MTNYNTFVKSLVIVPEGATLFSELVTTVSIDDEAAGPFVVVEQEGNHEKVGRVSIDRSEWPSIRDAIESQLGICQMIEANEQQETMPVRSDDEEAL